ncbi:MAG: hypothetical protein LBP28_05780 [Coriobacteriales bacterium]|jgi:hypothetical protein|nr:hypothetical protein [Coriobacteriales bacterium]
MTITVKSKVKDIFANDEAYAIVRKHMPDMDRDDPRMKQALGMSLQALLAFPATKCSKELRATIAEELEDADID